MDKIIVVYESQNKVIDMSLYDFIDIQYKNGNPFIVCNVTSDEFVNMVEQVKKGKLYELEPRLGHSVMYNQFRYMMNFDGKSNSISIRDYDNENETGNYSLSDGQLEYVNNEGEVDFNSKGGIKIYTMETFTKVINHYITNTNNLKNIKVDDLKRSISDLEKKIKELREKKYRLLGYAYINLYKNGLYSDDESYSDDGIIKK